MKKLLLMAFLILSFGIGAPSLAPCAETQAPAAGAFKWGVVDISRLMKESVPGKAGIKFIEAEQEKMQKDLNDIQTKLEKNPEDQTLMQELQKIYAAYQQKIQQEGQDVANRLLDLVQTSIDKYRKDNGYALLLYSEAVASSDPATDVTPAVMELVNASKLEFKATDLPAKVTPAEPKANVTPDSSKDSKKNDPKK